jgi:cation:H+ antiporter
MILAGILLLIGLMILVKSSDYFVDYSSRLAEKLGVSKFVVGLTIVAFGTSLPELVSSVLAVLRGSPTLAIGNIIGSNVTNICLILGLSASLAVINIDKKMLYRDGFMMLLASVILYMFMLNGGIAFKEAVLMLVLFFMYTAYVVQTVPKRQTGFLIRLKDWFTIAKIRILFGIIREFTLRPKGRYLTVSYHKEWFKVWHIKFKESAWSDLTLIFLSGILLWLGAEYTVKGAIILAMWLGIEANIIGLSVIALGTSLPELVVSITSVKRGHFEILVGNVLGSNITNILLVGGLSGLGARVIPAAMDINYSAPFMIGVTVLLLLFMRSKWRLRHHEGGVLLTLYAGFILWIASWFI